MALRIVRNDITMMDTEAIVNTANEEVTVGTGCDYAIYTAAGFDELLDYRKSNIGPKCEGDVFITPGFNLKAKYIIHAVSPCFIDNDNDENILRSCYAKSLKMAKEHDVNSIAFPLISTGSFGFPKEEGIRVAIDEISSFLIENEMEVYLVVFDKQSTRLGEKLYPDLEKYIDSNYVEEKEDDEYRKFSASSQASVRVDAMLLSEECSTNVLSRATPSSNETDSLKGNEKKTRKFRDFLRRGSKEDVGGSAFNGQTKSIRREEQRCRSVAAPQACVLAESCEKEELLDFEEQHESRLEERIKHISDTFSQYLIYLIEKKGMENAEVYKRAIVDKKVFSKIKNNVNYHPQKITALCLCVGAKLNLDETRDLLARAGYALSPCDKTDIIFSYFIENQIYDMIELDIQLEEYGLPCIIA